MTSTALTPMPRTTDPAATLVFHTDTLDFHVHRGNADAGRASLRPGSPARMLVTRQAANDATLVGQASCR